MKIYFSFYDYVNGIKNRPVEQACRDNLLKKIFEDYGMPAEAETVKNEYGKPYLKDRYIFYNISHSHGLVCICVGTVENGVDCELVCERNMYPIRAVCTEKEKEFLENSESFLDDFYSLWTYKESFIKLIGRGLSYSLKEIDSLSGISEFEGRKIVNYRKTIKSSREQNNIYSLSCMEYMSSDSKEPELIEVKF